MEWKVISSIMGKVWRELPDSEKQPYNEDYERRKVEYQQQM